MQLAEVLFPTPGLPINSLYRDMTSIINAETKRELKKGVLQICKSQNEIRVSFTV